jgi:hypothetical protein
MRENKRLSEEQAVEALMARQGPTTILSGAPGVATVVVRDHGAWEAQVAAENRARVDERIAAAVEQIERGDTERRYAPPAFRDRDEALAATVANAALARERREAPGRVARELAQTEALVQGMAAAAPPPPDPERARRDRDNDYSFGLAETMARLRG